MCDAADEAVGRPVSLLVGTQYNMAHRSRRHPIWDIIAGIGPLIKDWRQGAAA